MTEEVRARTCAACGWPALAGARRCPYCREPFPAPAVRIAHPARRAARTSDPLRWLVLAWMVAMVPTLLLVLSTLGMPLALPAAVIAVAPALFVWLLRRRSDARIGRFRGRTGRSWAAWRRSRRDPAGSGDRSPDRRRR